MMLPKLLPCIVSTNRAASVIDETIKKHRPQDAIDAILSATVSAFVTAYLDESVYTSNRHLSSLT